MDVVRIFEYTETVYLLIIFNLISYLGTNNKNIKDNIMYLINKPDTSLYVYIKMLNMLTCKIIIISSLYIVKLRIEMA